MLEIQNLLWHGPGWEIGWYNFHSKYLTDVLHQIFSSMGITIDNYGFRKMTLTRLRRPTRCAAVN